MPFKCNRDNFEKTYQNEYKGKISYRFIRESLNLPDSVRLKFNGTFPRWLFLIDENNNLYKFRYRIKTALWLDAETNKWHYVSIFPNFIKRWCQPSLNLLEYASCEVRKGEDILTHIDDPEEILLCEDRIVTAVKGLERNCLQIKYDALLNSKYVESFNRTVQTEGFYLSNNKRFTILYSLITTARHYFGVITGVLALVNNIIRL